MIIGLLVRTGIVVGAVYYSRKIGVWGDTEQSEKLYNELKEQMRPQAEKLQKSLPFEVPAMPQTGEMRFLAKHYYNEGVKGTFHFLEMVPCYVGQTVKKAKDSFEQFAKATPPDAKTGDK